MKLSSLSGELRMLNSMVEPYQVRFVKWALPRIPKFIETYHLTLLTILFSLLMVFAAKNMVGNRYFLLISAVLIFLQYLSDILDGALGRFRDTGLVRWGFYMDHFLDYFFSISTVVSYAIYYQIGLDMTMIVLLFHIILFSFVVFKTQKSFWIQDMLTKKNNHKIKKK